MNRTIFALLCLLPALTCQAGTIFVDANGNDNNDGLTPETAFATIQKGIDSAEDGDTVLVADGRYTGEGNRDIDFKAKAITVKSENGPETCIIDCEGTESHRGFYFYSGEGPDSVLSGFTITNGYAHEFPVYLDGAGILCEETSPTINNCTITGNSAEQVGGGISCWYSSPTITNCTITDNSAERGDGGGMYSLLGNPTLTNCTITDNSAEYAGGGISFFYSNSTLTNCTFSGNSAEYGGGMSADSATLVNCIFSGNSAYEGSGIYCGGYSSPTITSCIITGNSAEKWGGGIACGKYSNPIITNCTIIGNKGGGLHNCAGPITSCIIWDNTPYDLSSSSVPTYSCYPSASTGTGNIDTDPCFVEPDNGDYHLLEDSPCINTGDPDYIPEPNETDLDGRPRILFGRIDMGAYEFNHIPIADAGPNQTVYAWIDSIAEVTLDGSDSNDPDDDELTYLWTWTIEPNTYDTNGVTPTIELPVGQHTIELIVNDGIDDSEPNYVTITVVEPMESHLWIFPRLIYRYSQRQRRILAWLRLPKGVTKDQIDSNTPLLLYPGEIEPTRQYIFQRGSRPKRVSIIAYFDKRDLMDVISNNGRVELKIVGRLKTGQYFYGSDTVRIINRPRRPILTHSIR